MTLVSALFFIGGMLGFTGMAVNMTASRRGYPELRPGSGAHSWPAIYMSISGLGLIIAAFVIW